MASTWLDGTWVAATTGLVPAPAGRSGTYQVVVSGPDGELRYRRRIDDGTVKDEPAGDAEQADVTFTLTEADARAIVAGALDPTVAFMQGRLKTAGDPGWVLDLLAAWSSPEGLRALRGIAAAAGLDGDGPAGDQAPAGKQA